MIVRDRKKYFLSINQRNAQQIKNKQMLNSRQSVQNFPFNQLSAKQHIARAFPFYFNLPIRLRFYIKLLLEGSDLKKKQGQMLLFYQSLQKQPEDQRLTLIARCIECALELSQQNKTKPQHLFASQGYKQMLTPPFQTFQDFRSSSVSNLQCRKQQTKLSSHPQVYSIAQIDTRCLIRQFMFKWEQYQFRLQSKQMRIRIRYHKKDYSIDLYKYYARHSTKHANTVVFDLIHNQASEKYKKWQMQFADDNLYKEIYNQLRECAVRKCMRDMQVLLTQPQIQRDFFQVITQQQIDTYINRRQLIMKGIQQFTYERVFSYDKRTLLCSRNASHFKFQCTLPKRLVQSKKLLSIVNRQSNHRLIRYQKVQSITTDIVIGYFKYNVRNQPVEMLGIVEDRQQKRKHTTIVQAISNEVVKNKAKTIIINMEQIDNQTVCVAYLETPVELNAFRQLVFAKDFLDSLFAQNQQVVGGGEFQTSAVAIEQSEDNQRQSFVMEMREKINFQEEGDDEDFFSSNMGEDEFVSVKDFIMNKMQFHQECVAEEDQIINITKQNINRGQYEQKLLFSSAAYTTNTISKTCDIGYYCVNQPLPKEETKLMNGQQLWGEWKRGYRGGFVCINEAILSEQKKVLKRMLLQMGNNLFKHKNIMNVSFPVQIFKKQSHLVTVARNFAYAPMLLQNLSSDPLERMKAIITFIVSQCQISLASTKPFNPILGETYQGLIDGCPIALQQISHHPPITSVYFRGRGYKIYGNVAFKVTMGFNCLKGINSEWTTVEFDDSNKILFNLPELVINGIVFKERTLNYQAVRHIYDQKNLLFAEISFGAKHNADKNKNQHFTDYLEGKVYSVERPIMDAFLANKPNLSFRNQNLQTVSKFSGFWCEQLKINDEPVIDFSKKLPYNLESIQKALPSNSWNREDICFLCEGNMERSQQEKERLEENQRKDQKIRQANAKKRIK